MKNLRYTLFIAANILFLNVARCQVLDTVVVFFKNSPYGPVAVKSLDNADFIRLIIPPGAGEKLAGVKEFYKNGKIKSIGKTENKFSASFYKAKMELTDDYVDFYPSGRKETISRYDSKADSYSRYCYYPDGKIYTYTKVVAHIGSYRTLYHDTFIECYNDKGDMICSDGNGQWLVYDPDYKKIILAGPVKNGAKEGEWHGAVMQNDTLKCSYTYTYKGGNQLSAIGFDKQGHTYPFVYENEEPSYHGGSFEFLDAFKQHLKVPKDASGNRVAIDSVFVSFIVEKDGRVTNMETIGKADQALKDALTKALARCSDWKPQKLYGIPARTKITLPLNYINGTDNTSYEKLLVYKIQTLDD